jgi:hypothetical protein
MAAGFGGTPAMSEGPTASPVTSELPTGCHVGNYRIERCLGRGAMGEVYAARDCRTDRPIALKVLQPGLLRSPSLRRQLYAEGWMAAALDHPHICTVHEIGEADGRPFVAMELVEGQTLRARAAERPFDAATVLAVARQLAAALREAHAHHVVHRDLKSSNILITADDQVRILDFGIALQMIAPLAAEPAGAAEPGIGIGTTAYASPEQVLGRQVDERSDLFSLGVVLHELLTGRLPFSGGNRTDLIRAIVSNQPTPVDQINDAVPGPLSNVVTRLLAKDRTRRYQSSQDVLDDLDRIDLTLVDRAARAGGGRLTDSRWFHRIAGTAAGLVLAVGGLFPATVVLSYEAEAAIRSTAARRSGVWTGLVGARTLDAIVTATASPDSIWIGDDGRVVYGTTRQGGRASVWTVAPREAAPSLVSDEGRTPSVAPNAGFIVFAGDQNQRLYRAGLDGSVPEWIGGHRVAAPTVLPDGLAVIYREIGSGHVWSQPLDGGDAVRVTNRAITSQPFISPNGRALAFEHQGQTIVCDLPRCTGERRLAVGGLRGWTPDGRHLAYIGPPRGANIWVTPIAGGAPRQVTWFTNRAVSSVAWSADGSRLAVTRVPTIGDLEIVKRFR